MRYERLSVGSWVVTEGNNYDDNKRRVKEIYEENSGKRLRRPTVHHIIRRSDNKRVDPVPGRHRNRKANLCPLDGQWEHSRVERMIDTSIKSVWRREGREMPHYRSRQEAAKSVTWDGPISIFKREEKDYYE